jgi:hypothetical protein
MLISVGGARAQYLTGDEREKFVSSTFDGCMRPRNFDPVTGSVPEPIFAAICKCYANGLANRLTASEIKTDNHTVTDPVIKDVAKACYAAVKAETLRQSGK